MGAVKEFLGMTIALIFMGWLGEVMYSPGNPYYEGNFKGVWIVVIVMWAGSLLQLAAEILDKIVEIGKRIRSWMKETITIT